MNEKTIIIFTATHVKFIPPNNPIYVPLHVGREGKEDLGYLGDNVGNNISDMNDLFGELTGLFWIWQNIRDIDYVGLCHYRRYFLSDAQTLMTREEYTDILSKYDAVVPKHAQCEGSYYNYYGQAHEAKYLDEIGHVMERLYPEYVKYYQAAMEGNIFYSGNLMVTSLEVLKSYSEWLFAIFTEVAEVLELDGYDDYHKRIFGFLSEQMFYVYMMKNKLSYRETLVGIAGEKAETLELRQKVKALMDQKDYVGAMREFEQTLQKRPDVMLAGSDIHGELGALYRELQRML